MSTNPSPLAPSYALEDLVAELVKARKTIAERTLAVEEAKLLLADRRTELAADAPPRTREELQRGFYCGLLAALTEHPPPEPSPEWSRLCREVSAWVRSDIRRLERAQAQAGDCWRSRDPGRLSVSRCITHGRVELWIDGMPYALDDKRALKIADALRRAAEARP